MISPRLRKLLVRAFVMVNTPKHPPRAFHVGIALSIGTSQGTYKDWSALAKKGLVTFRRSEGMAAMWGVDFWNAQLTDAGREELADDVERLRRECCAPERVALQGGA